MATASDPGVVLTAGGRAAVFTTLPEIAEAQSLLRRLQG
jgi:hypothetical protein